MHRCPLGTPRPLKSRGGARGLAWTQSVSGARTAGRTACLLRPTRTSGAGPALPHSAASGVLAAAGIEQHPRSTGARSHSTRSLADAVLPPARFEKATGEGRPRRFNARSGGAPHPPVQACGDARDTVRLCGAAAPPAQQQQRLHAAGAAARLHCTPFQCSSRGAVRPLPPACARRRVVALAGRPRRGGSFPRRARGFLLGRSGAENRRPADGCFTSRCCK